MDTGRPIPFTSLRQVNDRLFNDPEHLSSTMLCRTVAENRAKIVDLTMFLGPPANCQQSSTRDGAYVCKGSREEKRQTKDRKDETINSLAPYARHDADH